MGGSRHLPVRLTLEQERSLADPDSPFSFTIEIELSSLGAIAVEGVIARKTISLHFWVADESTAQILTDRIGYLRQRLQSSGFHRVIVETNLLHQRLHQRSYHHINIVL